MDRIDRVSKQTDSMDSQLTSVKWADIRKLKPGFVSSVAAMLRRWLANLVSSQTEPKIWQEHDSYGNRCWAVEDPLTKYPLRFYSDNELRHWLEQRYRH